MNRIYQGRVSKVQTLTPGSKGASPEDWIDLPDWPNALWQHHELFQDAVNYYVVCLLALAQPGNPIYPIREKLDAKNEAGEDDERMVWRPFRRRGATRRGLRDSVAKYLTPGNEQPTPEECFTAVLAGTRLNFFADLGSVAEYDLAEIDGKSGIASGRGIWGTIKSDCWKDGQWQMAKDWQRCLEINAARVDRWKRTLGMEDNVRM